MTDLSGLFREVEQLKADLSAEIVEQEEQGHEEAVSDRNAGWDAYSRWVYSDKTVWVVDKPRIARPDVSRREAATARLRGLRDSSDWYAVRYKAAEALGITGGQLAADRECWVNTLFSELGAAASHDRARQDLRALYRSARQRDVRQRIADMLVIRDGFAPEDLSTLDERDLTRLYRRRSTGCQASEEVVWAAGKELGYSRLRIWARLRPVQAGSCAALILGLLYLLLRYLMK